MSNLWTGYSERGLLASWLFDLCNEREALKEFKSLGEFKRKGEFFEQISKANAITVLFEPSFADFGDPDAVIIFRKGEDPTSALYIEAKRGPLITEWTDSVGNQQWNASHLVVQVARRFAFMKAVPKPLHEGQEILFSSSDYWPRKSPTKKGVRKMRLKKPGVLRILQNLTLDRIPAAVATLTSTSKYGHGEPSIENGDKSLDEILAAWDVPYDPKTLHFGFDDFLNSDAFPVFRQTFKLNCWDTIKPVRWKQFKGLLDRDTANALLSAFQNAWVKLKRWAGELDWSVAEEGTHARLIHKRRVRARIIGCFGPGGLILDLQFRQEDDEQCVPEGWRRWGRAEWGIDGDPPSDGTWRHLYLVPE